MANEIYPLGFRVNFAEVTVKDYLVREGVQKDKLLNFCRNEVKDWLAGQGVKQTEFALMENGEGVLHALFVLDTDGSDWRNIPRVNDFLVADDSPAQLRFEPQGALDLGQVPFDARLVTE